MRVLIVTFLINVSFVYKVSLGAMALLLGKSLIRSFITNDLVHPQRTCPDGESPPDLGDIRSPYPLPLVLFPNLVCYLSLIPKLSFMK